MKAEEVYNIAIHLTDEELNRLCTLLTNRLKKKTKVKTKKVKLKLITDQEAREYVLRVVFGVINS